MPHLFISKIVEGKIKVTHIFVIPAFVENSSWICIGGANKSHKKILQYGHSTIGIDLLFD
jgi:hypothetical protein